MLDPLSLKIPKAESAAAIEALSHYFHRAPLTDERMAIERRYSEDEMREIFERAAQAQQEGDRPKPLATGDLTLEQIQAIGQEVGIPAELVKAAAGDLDRAQPVGIVKRLAGLPIGVSRTVELGRRLSDTEWEQLVAELRVTFDARGTVRQEGGLRQWTNGNLQVYLEPSGDGHRLRLRTVKGQALALIRLGTAFLAGSAVLGIALAASGSLVGRVGGVVYLAITGAAAIVFAAVQLPGWARERARQMDMIASRASDLSS